MSRRGGECSRTSKRNRAEPVCERAVRRCSRRGSSRGAILPTQSSRSARGKLRRNEHASSVDLRKSHRGGVCSRRKACEHDCKRQGSTPKSREAISKGPTPCKGSTWMPRSAPRKLENRLLKACHVKSRVPASSSLFPRQESLLLKALSATRNLNASQKDRQIYIERSQSNETSFQSEKCPAASNSCSCRAAAGCLRLPPLSPPLPPSLYLP